MGKKFEALVKEYNAMQARKEGLQKDINDLTKQAESADAAAEAAAKKGDENKYIEQKKSAEESRMRAYVKQQLLKTADAPIDPEAAQEAWREYVPAVNAKLKKAFENHKKLREELFKSFRELDKMQMEAFLIREQLADITGYHAPSNIPYDLLDRVYEMYRITGQDLKPDTDFFIAVGLMAFEQAVNCNIRLNSGKTFI